MTELAASPEHMRGARAIAIAAAALVLGFGLVSLLNFAEQKLRAPDLTLASWAQGVFATPDLDGAVLSQGGAVLFERLKCQSCHKLDGRGGIEGPVLNGVRMRKTRDEIITWLNDPQALKPGTPMPTYGLTQAQTWLLADFLMTK